MGIILHIAWDDRRSGAGAGARLLHEALLERGIASELWVFRRTTEQVPGVHLLGSTQKPARIFGQAEAQQVLEGRELKDISLVHLHGLGNQVLPQMLPVLQNCGKLLWSLTDCGPYTGGCHHAAHCHQWQRESNPGCSECPRFMQNKKQQDIQQRVFAIKKEIQQKASLTFLCQNPGQQDALSRSIAAGQGRDLWPLLIDREQFHLADRRLARQGLAIPSRAFVVVLPTDLTDNRQQVLDYLRMVLADIRMKYTGYLALVNFGRKPLEGEWAVDELRNVDSRNAALCAEYYRAANLQLYLDGIDDAYVPVREAAFCGIPSLVFRLGVAETVLSEETGAFCAPFDRQSLAKVLLDGMSQPETLAQKGMKAYLDELNKPGLNEYLQRYLPDAASLQKTAEVTVEDYHEILCSGLEDIRQFLLKKLKIWEPADTDSAVEARKKKQAKKLFLDQFCTQWLDQLDPGDKTAIWDLVQTWIQLRGITIIEDFASQQEVTAYLTLCRNLRSFLVRYFRKTTLEEFGQLPASYTDPIAKLWYFVFTNIESVLHRAEPVLKCPPEIREEEGHTGYPLFLMVSMYLPYAPRDLKMDIGHVLTARLPVALRAVVSFWLISAPLFDGTVRQQQTVLHYIEETSHFLSQKGDNTSIGMRHLLLDRMMVSLWRLSYLGGNTIRTLRAYGDLLQSIVRKDYKEYFHPIKPRHRKAGEKLRVGYISLNFRSQAVSQYMANRIKYHDKERFWVKSFILEQGASDSMTENIRNWSEAHETFSMSDPEILRKVAAAVKKSRLDLVVYADIGMNTQTYMLGAMHLAPTQAVLVGHGTTTGLTSIDYYVSGDHEPANAQEHYVEKLVRLPNAGAAQLPPNQSDAVLTREQFGVPDDAVLFISCANGLKHVSTRDHLLVEILQRAKNAYILLKPFVAPPTIDWKFRDRVLKAAKAAGVDDRLKIIPPLAQSGDLMALIKLADVQIDTYPYGGWTTNLEAIYYHLPVVTQQGGLARSRWGAGLLQAMGIADGIAHSDQEYVDQAVRFAEDAELRANVSKKIAEQAPKVLFNGEAAQPSYEAALWKMVEEKEKKIKH